MRIEIIHSTLPGVLGRLDRGVPREPGLISDSHIHDECELLFCQKGAMRINFTQGSVFITKGDILFINEHTPHKTTVTASDSIISLLQFDRRHITPDSVASQNAHLTAFFNVLIPSFYIWRNGDPCADELMTYFDRMEEELAGQQPAYKDYIKGYLYLVTALLERQGIISCLSTRHNSAAVRRLAPLFSYIDTHFNQPLTLEELGNTMNLDPSYLCRLFKRTLGHTIGHYLNFVRIREAENLLLYSEMNITEISFATGFTDPVYFDRVFKRFNGCTPTAYRKFKYLPLSES